MCRAPGSSSSTEYPGSLATSAQSSSASLPTSRDQRAHPLQLLQQGVLSKGAQRRGRRRGCAPPPATSGRTASAGSNFVVRTALGRRRPASILIQPGLAPSILSRRSSQTIHSESLLDPAQCFPLFEGVARSRKVARDATTNVPGERGRLDGTITELTKLSLLSIVVFASNICTSL